MGVSIQTLKTVSLSGQTTATSGQKIIVSLTPNLLVDLFNYQDIGGYIIGSGSGLTILFYYTVINKPDLAKTANLNSLSINSSLSIKNHTNQISNLNNTTSPIINNVKSWSKYSNFHICSLDSSLRHFLVPFLRIQI